MISHKSGPVANSFRDTKLPLARTRRACARYPQIDHIAVPPQNSRLQTQTIASTPSIVWVLLECLLGIIDSSSGSLQGLPRYSYAYEPSSGMPNLFTAAVSSAHD